MNFIEAIKSGHPISRRGHKVWSNGSGFASVGPFCPEYFLSTFHLSKEDVIADDWEIEEKKTEITERQAEIAFELVKRYYDSYNPYIDSSALKAFKSYLGFK